MVNPDTLFSTDFSKKRAKPDAFPRIVSATIPGCGNDFCQ